jgi:hypothetical protein
VAGNVLGALLVKLGLDAAEFTSGLTKAQYQAQQFARGFGRDVDSLKNTIRGVAGAVGGLYLGDVFLQNAKSIIAEAEALNDLADSTGASVKELSALRNQAYIAGTDIGTLQTALNKLSAGMAGTDEETSKAKDALKALGITTRDPAQAFQEIAQKLSTYEDGVNKVGIAVALFGKSGASLLPILKDIAELQDVGATVTKQQADAAENLGKEYRRLTVEATAFKDILLSGVVPALADTIKAFRIAQGQGSGFFQSLDYALRGQGEISENIVTLERNIASLTDRLEAYKATTSSSKPAFAGEVAAMTAEIEKAKRALTTLKAIQGPKEMDFGPPVLKGQAPSGFGGAKESKAAKEQISDAERYIKSLKDQVEKTLDLTAAEQVLREVQDGRLEKATRKQIDQALAYAQEIDAAKEVETWLKDLEKRYDDEAKAIERSNQERGKRVDALLDEAEQIVRANEDLRDEIAIIVGGEGVRDALEQQRLDNAIAIKEEALAMAELDPLRQSEAEALRIQINLLRERAGLLGGRSFAKQLAEEARTLQDVKNMLSDTFADAFTDFATGAKSAKEAFADFANSISRQIARIAAQNLANAIFGGNNSAGPDIFGVLAKILGGGSAGPGGTPGIIPGDIPAFATGGMPSSGFALVGERGPELVQFRGGERVYSHGESRAMLGDRTINQQINVTVPNTSSRPSVQQMTRRALEQLRTGARRL